MWKVWSLILFYFIIYYSNNTFFFLHKIFIKSYEIRVYEQICTHLILSLYIFLLQTKHKWGKLKFLLSFHLSIFYLSAKWILIKKKKCINIIIIIFTIEHWISLENDVARKLLLFFFFFPSKSSNFPSSYKKTKISWNPYQTPKPVCYPHWDFSTLLERERESINVEPRRRPGSPSLTPRQSFGNPSWFSFSSPTLFTRQVSIFFFF